MAIGRIFVFCIFLTSCISSRTVKSKTRIYLYKDVYFSAYLELKHENTFLYRDASDINERETYGVYMETKDSIFLFSTEYDNDYYNDLLRDCEKIYLAPHLQTNEIVFAREGIHRKDDEVIIFRGLRMNLKKESGVPPQKPAD